MKRIDFHAHILPALDHGTKNLEVSHKQLEWAKRAQVGTIVATSHFYGWRKKLEDFLPEREAALNLIKPQAEAKGIKIVPAAEVTLYRDLSELPGLEELRIEGTSYMLLEMPSETWGNWVYTEIEKIISKRNLQPIIAHLDRYPAKDAENLLQWNLTYQINAEALQSFWGARKYIKWFNENLVHVLGSDVHGDDGKDYLNFENALKRLGSQEERKLMSNAQSILADQRI